MLGRKRRSLRRAPPLGVLEIKVLGAIWDAPEDTNAQGLLDALTGHSVSLSTIQTTLKRLHRKGLVSRQRVGHAYVYRPAVSREALISLMLEDVTHRLAGGDLETVISGFFDLIDRTDPDLRTSLGSRNKPQPDDE